MKTVTLSISQFNTFVKNILDSEDFLSGISVFGEVTNFKISGANAYFDLKDENAMLSCVKFGAGDINFKNGDMITVYGKVNFYVKSGRLNFIVARAEAYGMGELYQKFLLLKDKLEKEGIFAEEIKKQIPKFATAIGVVTSETGAVIRDIIHVTRKKNPYTNIIVYPSKVQGVGAENEISAGIKYFNSRDDINTIIVARGGGSFEDLSPFNTEVVARAIFESKKPIISAVGHETDFTICDFASDLRVPTPSVAAEVAVFDYYAWVQEISNIASDNYYNITKYIKNNKEEIKNVSESLIDKFNLKLEVSKTAVKNNAILIENQINSIYNQNQKKIELLMNVLSKQNPLEILKSGYVSLELGGKNIASVKELKTGDNVKITLSDGTATAEIKSIKNDNK